jgi:hypothetical protein
MNAVECVGASCQNFAPQINTPEKEPGPWPTPERFRRLMDWFANGKQ